jgi:hypothetical protein
MESKMALKARLGSAQAQADQQTATINRLRAELAATHERLARQAAHFMNEMKRIGAGTVPASGHARPAARAGSRPSLADRVAYVSPSQPASAGGAESSNGHTANGASEAPKKNADASAAEKPQAAEIPAQRRRLRLLDRITGQSKD